MLYSKVNFLWFASLAVLSSVSFGHQIPEHSHVDESLSPRSHPEVEPEHYDRLAVLDERATKEPDNYIVLFKKGLSRTKRDSHHRWLNSAFLKTHDFVADIAANKTEYVKITNNIKGYLDSKHLQGYYGTFRPSTVAAIKQSDDVAVVEKDSYDRISEFLYVQQPAPWGLGRLSHKIFESSDDNSSYVFSSEATSNTTIYILDSGVQASHIDFTDRVRWGADFVNNDHTDVVGHGTHVAGTAAGYTVGVSKYANIVAVKVIDDDRKAAISKIVQGISWIIEDHNKNPGQKSIINYSAVGALSEARDYAIKQANAEGILLVTAAGNSADDACKYGPANLSNDDGVISVGAINSTNVPADFSNFGSCVSVYAPGVNVWSCANTDTNEDFMYLSGTSMASPHVAGLVSYFWAKNPSLTMAQVKNLVTNSNNNQILNIPSGTRNCLAFNGAAIE